MLHSVKVIRFSPRMRPGYRSSTESVQPNHRLTSEGHHVVIITRQCHANVLFRLVAAQAPVVGMDDGEWECGGRAAGLFVSQDRHAHYRRRVTVRLAKGDS